MTRTQESESVHGQPRAVLNGSEAVARIERTICGDAVTGDPSVAEGLAMVGLRAASLFGGGEGAENEGGGSLPVSCVHHVGSGAEGAHRKVWAFEFAAPTVQAAVDHSLAAHALSQRIGRSGSCSMSRSLAGTLDLIELPGPGLVEKALRPSGDVLDAELGDEGLVDLAREVLGVVSASTGRPADIIEGFGPDAADFVLVGAGVGAAKARWAAGVLEQSGIPARAVSLTMVRPFPAKALREALGSVTNVFVVDDATRPGHLVGQVRTALNGAHDVRSLSSTDDDKTAADLLEGLSAHLSDAKVSGAIARAAGSVPTSRMMVAPAGSWGDEAIRCLAKVLSHAGEIQVSGATSVSQGACVLRASGSVLSKSADGVDLLLASHPSVLSTDGALGLVRSGGVVVLLSEADSAEALAEQLDDAAAARLLELGVPVWWLDPRHDLGSVPEGRPGERAAMLLSGACLVALGHGQDVLAQVAVALSAEGADVASGWLSEGAQRVGQLDTALLSPERRVREHDFRHRSTLPRLPEAVDSGDEAAGWLSAVRTFHLSGRGPLSASGPAPGLPVQSATIGSLLGELRARLPYPVALVTRADGTVSAQSVSELLQLEFETLDTQGALGRVAVDNRLRLLASVVSSVGNGALGADLGTLFAKASTELAAGLGLAPADAAGLAADFAKVAARLPANAAVYDLRHQTAVHLALRVASAARAPARATFLEELKLLRNRLRDVLLTDELSDPSAAGADAIGAALGGGAADLFDTAALSRSLHGSPASVRLDPARRARIEQVIAVFDGCVDGDEMPPMVVCVQSPGLDLESAPTPGAVLEHVDPLAAAVGVFDGLAARMAHIVRAFRIGRLEAEDAYTPSIHDTALASLDWEGFTAGELAIAPAVIALTTGQRLREVHQGSLSRLLRSSRPVQVLIQDSLVSEDDFSSSSGYHAGLGYLVVAHREALVVQSSLARPVRLVDGLARMARALRPSVALLTSPGAYPEGWRVLRAEAALQGRVTPDFTYDPDAGDSWAQRFDLSGNPQPEEGWPMHTVRCAVGGAEESLSLPFTFADAVALEPTYLENLRIIPVDAWSDEQLPLAEYIEAFEGERAPHRVPYIWVLDDSNTLQRAVVTRRLALAARDRLREWRVLQELGGFENEYARRAAERARQEAEVAAEARIAEIVAGHAAALESVRSESARESMERLASVLMNVDALPVGGATRAPAAAPAATPAAAASAPVTAEAPAAAPAPVEEEESLSFDEPYIDTILCTSCNECIANNGAMFKYNDDKQAYIADASKGTFQELVKSALACPAACIHPGKPRAGDSTATPELIEKAAAFN